MAMESNRTANDITISSSLNKSSIELYVVYEASLSTHMINAVISVCTILFNSCLLAVVRHKGMQLPVIVKQQLTGLAISDLVAGLVPGLWCLTLIQSANTNTYVCATVSVCFSTAQYATLLNLCFIAGKRWKILYNSEVLMQTRNNRTLTELMSTSLSWGISLIVHLPILAGITPNSSVNGCLSPELFDKREALDYVPPMYGVTLLALDVFCARTLYILYRYNQIKRRIQPNRTFLAPNTRNPRINISQHGIEVNHDGIFIVNNRHQYGGRRNTRPLNVSQRRAFTHLLVALVIANINTIPYLVLLFCFVRGILTYQPNDVIMYDMQVLALNSLLNPVIYGFHVREIRNFLLVKCRKLKNNVINRFV